jgi:hypothetical protein
MPFPIEIVVQGMAYCHTNLQNFKQCICFSGKMQTQSAFEYVVSPALYIENGVAVD